jgi:hypothetical protein
MEDDSLKEMALKHWLALAYGGLDGREYCESMRVIRKALDHVPENIKYRAPSLGF